MGKTNLNQTPESERHLIVAEDSHLYRTLLSQLLEPMGFKIIPCEDGAMALKALRSNQDKDIVGIVSDIYMPNMDGMEFLKAVRSEPAFHDLPFILVTAESEQENIAAAMQAGADEYLIKPITPAQLYQKLRNLFPHLDL